MRVAPPPATPRPGAAASVPRLRPSCCGRDRFAFEFDGRLELARAALRTRGDVEAPDDRGYSWLHGAVAWGYDELAAFLLESGANPNALAECRTPLHLAVAAGDVRMASLLLTHGADPTVRCEDSESALGAAKQLPGTELMALLLDHGAAKAADAETVVLDAARELRTDLLELFVAHQMVPTAGVYSSPLVVALAGHPEDETRLLAVHQLLLRAEVPSPEVLAEALCDAAEQGLGRDARLLLDHGAPLDRFDAYFHRTPLHCAVAGGDAELVRTMLSRGARADARHPEGSSPLVVALEKGHPELLAPLLGSLGSGPLEPKTVLPVLEAAADAGDLDSVAALVGRLRRGALASATGLLEASVSSAPAPRGPEDEEPRSGEEVPRPRRHQQVSLLLLDRGAPLPRTREAQVALFASAVEKGEGLLAARLLARGVLPPLEARTDDDEPVLVAAIRLGMPEVAARLVRRGGALAQPDRDGLTALHWAARMGNVDLLRRLVAAGHPPLLGDARGANAVAWAAAGGHLDAVQWLTAHGVPCADRAPLFVRPRLASRWSLDGTQFSGALAAVSAAAGDPKLVRQLVEQCGADLLFAAGGEGPASWSALDWAAAAGATEVVRYQLEHLGTRLPAPAAVRAMHLAAAAGRRAVVELLASHGPGLDARDAGGSTPLHTAVRHGQFELARALLTGGADPRAVDGEGHSVLQLAVASPELVADLLARGAEPDTRCAHGDTPLLSAVAADAAGSVQALLVAKADPDGRDANGDRPLDRAVASADSAVVGLLVEAGAGRAAPRAGVSAVVAALGRGDDDRWALSLLQRGIDETACARDPSSEAGPCTTPLQAALELELDDLLPVLLERAKDPALCLTGPDGALNQAILHQRWAVVDAVLEHCAPGNPDDGAAEPLPHRLARQAPLATFEVALRTGRALAVRDASGATVAHAAAEGGRVALLELLSGRGFDLGSADRRRRSALHVAAARGDPAEVALLLAAGVTPAPDAEGWTPLHDAAASGQPGAVQAFLDRKIDPNLPAADGQTPLHLAVAVGSKRVATVLLRAGAQVDRASLDGRTPLQLAAGAGDAELAALLLEAGADVDRPDRAGDSAVALGILSGHQELALALVERSQALREHPEAAAGLLRFALANGLVPLSRALVALGVRCPAAMSGAGAGCVELALAAGADAVAETLAALPDAPTARSTEGWPLLHFAVRHQRRAVAARLILGGADVGEEVALPFRLPETPLTLAVRMGDAELVRALLAAGADPDAKLADGSSASSRAEKLGQGPMRELLHRAHARQEAP